MRKNHGVGFRRDDLGDGAAAGDEGVGDHEGDLGEAVGEDVLEALEVLGEELAEVSEGGGVLRGEGVADGDYFVDVGDVEHVGGEEGLVGGLVAKGEDEHVADGGGVVGVLGLVEHGVGVVLGDLVDAVGEGGVRRGGEGPDEDGDLGDGEGRKVSGAVFGEVVDVCVPEGVVLEVEDGSLRRGELQELEDLGDEAGGDSVGGGRGRFKDDGGEIVGLLVLLGLLGEELELSGDGFLEQGVLVHEVEEDGEALGGDGLVDLETLAFGAFFGAFLFFLLLLRWRVLFRMDGGLSGDAATFRLLDDLFGGRDGLSGAFLALSLLWLRLWLGFGVAGR